MGDKVAMSEKGPEPRTAVMIFVDATWEDQSGTVQKCSARMENRSAGGACIRIRKPIPAGTKLKVRWRWEQFTGTARWSRSDGRDYLVGIQRDAEEKVIKQATKEVALRESEKQSERGEAAPSQNGAEKRQTGQKRELPVAKGPEESVPKVQGTVIAAATIPSPAMIRTSASQSNPMITKAQESVVLRETEPQEKPGKEGREGSKERKHMRRKWFGLGHQEEKQDEGSLNIAGTSKAEAVKQTTSAAVETKLSERQADSGGGEAVELLSMADIYQTAGILNPRKGYSILKVAEMLRSEHLRGLSKEMKRASVMVALDAAGISVEEVAQDAKARMAAIDSYEAEQRKQFEAHLARKAEENQQIMAELDRIKASYAERLRRNLEGVAREKATFGNWLTTKQQESQNITEALELCVKPEVSEPASSGLESSLVSANEKPV